MVLDFCPFGCLLSSFSAAFGRFPSFWLPFVFFFGCFLSISVLLAAFCLLFGCLLGPLLPPQSLKYWFWNLWFWISVLLAAFCLPFRLLFVDFRPFGCLLSSFSAAFCRFPSFWLPFCLLFGCLLGPLLPPQSLKYWFWNLWFWISVLLAAFCLLFRLLLVDFRPFGCLLSSFSAAFCRFPSFWLPFVFSLAAFWARCSLRSPLNIGFEIYGFGFLSFWLPFVFLFGCFLSISVLLAAFCLLFRLLIVDFRPFGCLLSSLWLPFGPAASSAVP